MSIKINMDKAREIRKDQLRAIRAPLLADLDVKFMRAIESQDTELQAQIAAQKQELRDVTKDPAIAEATTIAELKAALPNVLKTE